ncbi:ComEC family competence protein [Candidatus Kaiserbacteria bacterium]|nr:ComEC family competence protein [Candidatus Kaiserbacteria bacterium]
MGSRIVWAVVGGFLSGVFVASVSGAGKSLAMFVLLLGIVAVLFSLIEKGKKKILIVFAVACTMFSLGVTRMEMAARIGDPVLSARIGSPVVLNGIVTEEPDARETSVRVTVDVAELRASSTIPVRARVLVVAPAHTEVRYGDVVQVKGALELPESFDTTAGRLFDYPSYLAKDGVLYTVSFAKITKTGESLSWRNGSVVKAAAIRMKYVFLDGLGAALPEPEAGLAGGITVGDKRSIGKELSEEFQRVSLIHMVVLSGYNITVVVNAVTAYMGAFSHAIRFSAAGFIVMMFALMAGGAASAVRAGLMALIAIFARITHRVFLAERVLGVVACLMVFWNPWTLVFDPGFQLSALATLGLILYTPIFSDWLSRVPERFGLREIVASTCGTQLMVLPLLLYQNGSLSIVALPANLFALITVPLAMFASFVAAVAGMVTGPLAPVFGAPAYLVLRYEISVAHVFASLPYAAVLVPAFGVLWLSAAYAFLAAAYVYVQKKKGRALGSADSLTAVQQL